MPAARIRSWKSVALATSAVLVGIVLPAATASPASATTTAYDATYYANAIGKTGTALKSSLHTIISPQTKLSYSAVWEALKVTDQDPNNSNNVKLLYSGISRSKTLNGGNSGNWNREHVWAQSHGDFGTSAGPGTDLHHLRPEDVTVNAIRGNLDFDNGGSSFTNSGGSLVDSNSFEPRDAVKGDVARMILYMAVRYEGDDGWPNLEPNDLVTNGGTRFHGRLSVLKAWNDEDPPDSFEERRNELIYTNYQRNRNPFIDHPEWVEAIW
ncbi:endonuclease I family protein [Streptomyces sp. NPDC014892]|uniref:endonuclease I family protein n=1 Tax=Streptomyces TaxID=1883 RepID=UPI001EFBC8EF|nr:endonuclease [Streptomyces deccanensis]ULR50824.1 endonuclease [Streptomyces deccanensis]